jgi:hypothetical protein
VAPASIAGTTSVSVSKVVSTSTRAPMPFSAISLIALTPSRTGIRRSISTTSGCRAAARSTASRPLAASPATSNSPLASKMPRRPSRTTG